MDVKNIDMTVALESKPSIQCEHKSEKEEAGVEMRKMASGEQIFEVRLRLSSAFPTNK